MDYPASKDDIVRHAQQQGGDKEVIEALEKIPDLEYEGPSGVSSEVFN